MPINKNSLVCLLTTVIFSCGVLSLSAVDEYPENTVKILAKYKIKMKKVLQAKERFIKMTKQSALTGLSKEMTFLTQTTDLDRAIAARDLLRKIKKGEELPEISVEEKKKYRPNAVNIVKNYKKKLGEAEKYLNKNKTKIIEDMNTELDEEMVKMDKKGFIADSLTIKQLLEKTKEPDFNLAAFQFAIQKTPSKKEVKKEVKKVAKKPEINYDELIHKTSLAIGNNILSDDISSEKGMKYVCLAENLNPSNKVPMIREKIEKGLFLPILPSSMSEEEFLTFLEKCIRKILLERPHHQDVLKYCIFLCHFKPELKKDKDIAGFIAKSGKKNDIMEVLNYNKDMFGGANETEDIRMQIDKTNGKLIAKLLNQAKQLQTKYPKNKSVKELVADLSAIKVPEEPTAATAPATQPGKTTQDCATCNATGWVNTKCTACKEGEENMCERCIGSGSIFSQIECDSCKGSGKTWLGLACKKCKGKGKIKVKKVCPDCKGEGKKKCPECQGKGFIRKKCPDCQGTGKVEK